MRIDVQKKEKLILWLGNQFKDEMDGTYIRHGEIRSAYKILVIKFQSKRIL
jgi:hypothetical protein